MRPNQWTAACLAISLVDFDESENVAIVVVEPGPRARRSGQVQHGPLQAKGAESINTSPLLQREASAASVRRLLAPSNRRGRVPAFLQ